MKREMSESRGSVTCEDIFGEESSTSGTSDEEDLTQTAERPRKPPWAAPAKRMLLSLQQKLAAISHFQSNMLDVLACWIVRYFKMRVRRELTCGLLLSGRVLLGTTFQSVSKLLYP